MLQRVIPIIIAYHFFFGVGDTYLLFVWFCIRDGVVTYSLGRHRESLRSYVG